MRKIHRKQGSKVLAFFDICGMPHTQTQTYLSMKVMLLKPNDRERLCELNSKSFVKRWGRTHEKSHTHRTAPNDNKLTEWILYIVKKIFSATKYMLYTK